MNLVLRGDLLKRLVAPKSLQCNLGLQFPRKPASPPHRLSLRHSAEYTLATCPIFRGTSAIPSHPNGAGYFAV